MALFPMGKKLNGAGHRSIEVSHPPPLHDADASTHVGERAWFCGNMVILHHFVGYSYIVDHSFRNMHDDA